MNFSAIRWAILLGLINLNVGIAQIRLERFDFQIMEREFDATTSTYRYFFRPKNGTERPNNSLNRLSMLSENQYTYPEPENACGPTAMLNILIWYEKFGLIEPTNRDSNTEHYKLAFFKEIDQRLNQKAGTQRADRTGTNNLDSAIVMDDLVHERSKGKLRIHSDYLDAPLKLDHFLKIMPHFRSGYLIVRPKDPHTGKLRGLHAVTVIRADRAGYLSLGTWGQMYRGLLKTRGGTQWFIPQDPKHLELQILGLMRFIPFEPTTPEDHRPR